MGYDITIGNAEPELDWENYGDDQPRAEWIVKTITHEGAPYFSDSGRRNDRSPSYTAWSDFTEAVGLHDLFYNKETGLMREHPGIVKLTSEHASKIALALELWKTQHPDDEATHCECDRCHEFRPASKKQPDVPHNPHASAHLVRLTWLDYWVRWACENCAHPAIHNT